MIPRGVIDVFTRMVLANAIYFDAQWENQFAEDSTKMEPFYLLDGGSIDAPMMNVAEEFGFVDGFRFLLVFATPERWYAGHHKQTEPSPLIHGGAAVVGASASLEPLRRVVGTLAVLK